MGWRWRGILACAALGLGLLTWAALERWFAPHSNTTQEHFDVLIVLGNPADADGNPTPIELERVTEAVREYERGVAPRIIFTGGAAHNQFVEAKVMARIAEAQGIPASVVLEEAQARDTIENTCDSLRMMRNRGWGSAEVISSASQLPRAGLMLSRLPLKWRVHAALPLAQRGMGTDAAGTAIEILKTAYYLVWSRQTKPCVV